jgi:hypothetical protein
VSDTVIVPVIDGIELVGDINTPDDVIRAQIAHAIRQDHPQARPEFLKPDVVALVGSGPSLNNTVEELRDLMLGGAKIVTTNGALQWCLDHNFRPSATVVLDARPSTARFVAPEVPGCLHYVASQCHPDVWATVARRERVAIWHAAAEEGPATAILDDYYGKGRWMPVPGGSTVASRALLLLRQAGYTRFHLFGVDSCWLGDQHHAFDQPENETDKRIAVDVTPSGGGETQRFFCAPWHLKQFEDFLLVVRTHGHEFRLNLHGDGLLAYALKAGAAVSVQKETSHGSWGLDSL